jgi:KDO2-lipid IV(A) lauroyltransferase
MMEKNNQQQIRGPEDGRGKFATLIANMPHKHIAGIGRVLGRFIYFVDVRHRRIVRRNLKFIYPEWTHHHVKRVSKRIFENLGMTVSEIFQMIYFSEGDITDKVKVSGKEHLLNAMQKKKGVILISAHLGNWEIVTLFWPLYFKMPMTVVARQLQNHLINRWVYKFRTRFGTEVIYKEGAMPEMTRALRQDKVLAMLIDQGTRRSQGIKITFFNKFVIATPAAALLAFRCQSPVLPVFCIRNNDGTFTMSIGPSLALKTTDNLRTDLKTNTQIIMNAIEEAIRKYPEQWFWVHKRWKKYYPHLYQEDMAKRLRRRAKKFKRMQSE